MDFLFERIFGFMANSGLLEILSQVYANSTGRSMLQGKAVSPAVQRHGLFELALDANLLSSELNSRVFDGNDMLAEPLEKTQQTHESLLEGDTIDEAQVSELAVLIYEILHIVKEPLSRSRTARPWFQCLDPLAILRKNLRAGRSVILSFIYSLC